MTGAPTILVVEDNPTTRKMLRLALVTEGYRVVEAADARAALAAVENAAPDLILQDLILPDMDGLELLRRLRALPGGSELPIVALSGFLSRLEEAQTDAHGFTALLVKPIEPSRLIEALGLYLPQRPASAAARGDGLRLLIVDDDPMQLKLTRIHFSQLGFKVAVASGASDALFAARTNPPDVVLSDVFMPGVDGFDLCLSIRQDPKLVEVPVVLLSSQYGSKADEDLARRVGASALVLRTPDFGNVAPAILEALRARVPTPAEQPSDALALTHARLVIHQLERQAAGTEGLSQRVGIQASQLSLLSSVADALTRKSDPDAALRDVLAATLDAAGISKGALILKDADGKLKVRQDIGFSASERAKLENFFGHAALLEKIVEAGGSVSIPSNAIPNHTSRDILTGASIAAAQIVPLISDGRGVGAMVIGASSRDVTSEDSIAFARAMGNQVVQSLELARSVAQLRLQGVALNAAANAIVITDRSGLIEWVNPAFTQMTGYAPAEAVGRNPRELVKSGRHDSAFYELLWKTISSGRVWHGEMINRRKDGSLYTEEQTITPLLEAGGEVSHFISVKQDITERRRAEEEISQGAIRSARAEREFRALFEANPLPMWIYDLTTLRFLEANGAAVRRYGYDRDEFMAMTIKDIRPAEDVERLLTEVAEPREAWQDAGNWRHRLKSGQVIDVDITSHTITFAGKSAALVVAQDITERKRAAEKIRHHAQVSGLTAAVGLALANSDTLAHALQLCAEALVAHLGATFARIWTLNERDQMLELQASAGLYTHLNGPHGRVPVGQFKIGRIARDRKPHLTNAVIGDPEVSDQEWARREGMVAFAGHPLIVDDRVVGVMALFARQPLSDAVTSALAAVADHVALGIARHRGIEAVRTTEERMRFALQTADVGIWDMDYTTGALRWSEIVEAHYGVAPGTFEGTFEAFVERIHPDDRKSVLKTVGQAMKTGSEFVVQNRSLWPDGTVHWLSGAGRVLLGDQGEPVRAVGISLDVTERRLLEDQYRQAQKMEAVGRLAGGVAHDFNNVLTVILGYCDLLLMDLKPGDDLYDDIAEIQTAGSRAAGLTRQLLAFSRKQIIEPTLLDLNQLAIDLRAMLGRLIGEDVKFELRLQPGLALVKADRGQVEQIVMNLAVNARDAMPNGGTLFIETANVELDEDYAKKHATVKPGPYVLLAVTDTGTGMTPEVQARLFEPFFTTKDPGKGTGLGMATVYGIVTRSGGTVGVYSELGKGTSFKVYFPRAAPEEKVKEVPTAVTAQPRVGTQTVLVVEDEDGVRELANKLLLRLGYTVLMAGNASEAIRLFDENPRIDLLLTDVVMPGASGPELTRQLIEQRPGLKVIYMSGYTEDAIVQHGVIKPGIAFLNKPFTSQTLGAKIREVLDR